MSESEETISDITDGATVTEESRPTPPSGSSRRYFRRVVVNTISVYGVRGIEAISGVLVFAILARYLGPANMGIYYYILALVGFFTPLIDWGISHVCIREAVQDKPRAAALFGSMHWLRVLLFAAVLPFVVVFVLVADLSQPELLSFVFCAITLLAVEQIFTGPSRAALLAFEKLHWDVLIAGAGTVLKLLVVLLVIRFGWHLPGIFAGLLCAAVLRAAFALVLVRLFCTRVTLAFDYKLSKLLLWASIPLGLTTVVFVYRHSLLIVLLKQFAGPEAISFFALPLKFVGFCIMLSTGLLTALYPGICRAATRTMDELRHSLNTLITFLLLGNFALVIVLYMLATQIITLVFGEEYSRAGPVMALFAIMPVSKSIDALYAMIFIATKQIRTYCAISVAASILSLGAAVVLIPILSYTGAALAFIVAEVSSMLIGTWVLSRTLGGSPFSGAIVWPGISFIAGMSCALLAPLDPVSACGLGLAVFAIVALVSRRRLGCGLGVLSALRPAETDEAVK